MSEWLDELREWLDTETKSILWVTPPTGSIALDRNSYSLLLLQKGNDEARIEEVVTALRSVGTETSTDYPFVVGQGWTLDDALVGQFALVCCDCVSAFVRDEIVDASAVNVYRQLHREVMSSHEFASVEVVVELIPDTGEGRRFGWQFLGWAAGFPTPTALRIRRKKARLMEHWGRKTGVNVRLLENE
jgi:hypothetical protein